MSRRPAGVPPAGGAPLRTGATLMALALLACPQGARAQLAIDRTELQLHTDSAGARAGVLLVRNEGAQRAQARLLVEDWDRAEDGTNRFHPPGTLAQSCAAHLEVQPRAILLEPGEAQPVRIAMDAAAAVREECWSVVLVESVQPRPAANGRVLLYTLRMGVKVYAAPSTLQGNAEVATLTLAPATPAASAAPVGGPSATPTGAAGGSARAVQLAVVNRGARHVVAHGRLEVRTEDNQVVAALPLPTVYALPGATRRLTATLPALPRGRYLLLAVFDYGGSELTASQVELDVP